MTIELGNITFDCDNAQTLATFYAELLGREVNPDASELFATVAGSPILMFLKVDDKTPGKNVIHLDLHAVDWQEEIARAVSIGAKHIGDFNEYGTEWATLADPEGNLFDIGRG
ncbi:VOC family protein [Nocardia camponoti]|uniref:Glyoxalase n=1 Tax=Nocardia camponoti TaxID=1616106 RepID=A0A917VBX5_9NOCA|nr:VOC family protein [Nocardia camponoti]GGK61035.1 glyoxalase [Nocardia camponoti]